MNRGRMEADERLEETELGRGTHPPENPFPSGKRIKWWLRHFPAIVRPDFSRSHRNVGRTKDRWTDDRPIHLIERRWNGLASISISVGLQKVTFYGTTIDSLRNGFEEALGRIERRDFLPSDPRDFESNLVYNFAHRVALRGTVFRASHPANALYRNSIEAVFHDDGAVSAIVSSKRPWHLMQIGFAPGFFNGIRNYLPKR